MIRLISRRISRRMRSAPLEVRARLLLRLGGDQRPDVIHPLLREIAPRSRRDRTEIVASWTSISTAYLGDISRRCLHGVLVIGAQDPRTFRRDHLCRRETVAFIFAAFGHVQGSSPDTRLGTSRDQVQIHVWARPDIKSIHTSNAYS